MIKENSLLLVFCFLPLLTSAQFHFPTYEMDPEWHMSYTTIGGPYEEEVIIRVGPDTMLCGEIWNPVDQYSADPYLTKRIGYYRQTTDSVLVRKDGDCSLSEYLMYDFSAEPGDTIYCGFTLEFAPQIVPMVVGSITHHWKNGQLEKVYNNGFFYGPWAYAIYFYEGVGTIGSLHPFFPLVCGELCPEGGYDLNCLYLGDNMVYSNSTGFTACPPTSDTIYVNQNLGSGLQNGTDWDNAFFDLRSGLSIVDSGDVVLVAAGTYFASDENDREDSFVIPNGVQIYGGFEGDELTIAEREIEDNPTILSGDIGMPNDPTDNSYHVLFSYGVDASTIIDGFIIEHGHADYPIFSDPRAWGGGYFIDSDQSKPNADPRILNCTFRNNYGYSGGGIYCDGRQDFASLSYLENCVFEDNVAEYQGGGVYKKEGNTDFDSQIINCDFLGNTAIIGGGYFFTNTSGDILFEGCRFNENYGANDGGAAYLFVYSSGAALVFIDCSFVDNLAGTGGAVSTFYGGQNTVDTSEYYFEKCLFERNTADGGAGGALSIGNHNSFAKLHFYDISFIENTSQIGGGGAMVFEFVQGSKTNVLIDQCSFIGNDAIGITSFGTIYHHGHGNGDSQITNQTLIRNSLFYGNDGVYTSTNGNNGYSDAFFENCTFYDNGIFPFGKTWHDGFDYITEYNNMTFTNSIIWEFTPVEMLFYNNDFVDYTIHDYYFNSCIINIPSCEVDGVDPCTEGILFETDPLFIDPDNGDFRLKACSPGINAGDFNLLSADNLFDLDGNPRILENIPDLGAYEQETFSIAINIQGTSDATTADGSIQIDSITGGTPPYTLLWDTGDTTYQLDDLLPGIYTLTITDATGCEKVVEYEVGIMSSTKEQISNADLKIYPNPATNQINLEFPGSINPGKTEVRIFNYLGQLVYYSKVAENQIDISAFPAGLYYVVAKSVVAIYRGEFVKS